MERTLKEKRVINLPALYDLTLNDEVFSQFLLKEGNSWIAKAESENSSINITSSNGILVITEEPSPYDAALAADYIRLQLLKKGETFTFETVLSHPLKSIFFGKPFRWAIKTTYTLYARLIPQLT